MVRPELEKFDVVMSSQRLALFVAKLQPGAAFAFWQVQNNVGPLGFPPGDCASRIGAVTLNQLRVAVDGNEEFVEKILAHASAPFGYQVKWASLVWNRSSVSA